MTMMEKSDFLMMAFASKPKSGPISAEPPVEKRTTNPGIPASSAPVTIPQPGRADVVTASAALTRGRSDSLASDPGTPAPPSGSMSPIRQFFQGFLQSPHKVYSREINIFAPTSS